MCQAPGAALTKESEREKQEVKGERWKSPGCKGLWVTQVGMSFAGGMAEVAQDWGSTEDKILAGAAP